MRNLEHIDPVDVRSEGNNSVREVLEEAIVELWSVLEGYVKMVDATRSPLDKEGSHPTLEKYREFVNDCVVKHNDSKERKCL